MIYPILLSIVFTIIFAKVLLYLQKESNKLSIKLDVLKIKVNSAKTQKELLPLIKELGVLNKSCFHKSLHDQVTEILTIIKIKNSFFQK